MRFFRILLGALAMMSVALLAALATMRLAIHGTEVAVPNLAGLSMSEASDRTLNERLNLSLENSFYSTTVPAGRVLAQSPAPGTKVRRQWNVRVTQSLGPQRVDIPDVVGLQQRAATINIRHLGLDIGVIARLSGRDGPPDTVLAQSPPANAAGIDRPRVSILLTQSDATTPADFVMPDLVRMSYAQAFLILSNAGLHVASLEDVFFALPAVTPPAAIASPAKTIATPPAGIAAPHAPAPPAILSGTVVAQSPPSGHRVTTADPIHLTLAR
jgi:beta-lactam-binding protein with PASTA domain